MLEQSFNLRLLGLIGLLRIKGWFRQTSSFGPVMRSNPISPNNQTRPQEYLNKGRGHVISSFKVVVIGNPNHRGMLGQNYFTMKVWIRSNQTNKFERRDHQ
jgi:hypothetical protein